MEIVRARVLLVSEGDYKIHFRHLRGILDGGEDVYNADLIIDKDTGKVLKSKYFPLEP